MSRINRVAWFILLFFATLMLAACGARPETSLAGTSWRLLFLNGEAPIPGTEITAQFDAEQILGTAGCNSYQANYEQNDGRLAVLDFVTTEVFCEEPAGVMDQEGQYMALMLGADRFQIQDDQLTLRTSDGETLVFERQQ
jgi:heat shock protein HslJ